MVPFLLLLLLTAALSVGQRPPPNYSPDALPETSFSCRGRQPGGYYADVEAGCQMFHVCGSGQGPSFKFLCPNDTVFDQQNLICANWFEVVCEHDSVLHARNFEIFKTNSNKESSFNMLHEDDLPELDDYDYETGFSAAQQSFNSGRQSFSSGRRFSSQRATTTTTRRPEVSQFDQFIAASTARPVVVTPPNGPRWRGSTITGTTTEAPTLPLRHNSLHSADEKLASVEQSEEERAPAAEDAGRASQTFDSVTEQPTQNQRGSAGNPNQSFGNFVRGSSFTESQSNSRESGRVPPTSAPAESQSVEITSRRFNSFTAFDAVKGPAERPGKPASAPSSTSAQTTLTASISVADSDLSSSAANALPTAAALTSDDVAAPQTLTRPSSTLGNTLTGETVTESKLSRPSSFSSGQNRFFSRTQSRFPTVQPSIRRGTNDISTDALPTTGPVKDSQPSSERPAFTSTPPSPARVTFSSPSRSESRLVDLESPATTTEPDLSISPVARSFFGPSVLPEVTARTVQTFAGSGGVVRQNTVVSIGGRSETPDEDDVAVTTFRPRAPTTSAPSPTAITTVEQITTEASTETSTDDGIEIITETTTEARPPQSSETTTPTVRRRGSRRRGGSVGRGSSSASLARPRVTPSTLSRSDSDATVRPVAPRTTTVTAVQGRSSSSTGRRGRGGRRFNPTVKPVLRRRQKVTRVDANAEDVEENIVGVDGTQAKVSAEKDESLAVSTTESSLAVADDQATASSISRAAAARPQFIRTDQRKSEVTTTQATTTAAATNSTPQIIRRRIRVQGRPSRRPNRRPSRRQIAAESALTEVPAPSLAPSAAPATDAASAGAAPVSESPSAAPPSSEPAPAPLLPTNKEVAPGGVRLLRQPKLPLSSALPVVGQSRRLRQNTSAREARSGATRLLVPASGARYSRRPAALAPAPVATRQVTAQRRSRAGSLLSDYDYEYYDDEGDVMFRKLAEANEILLDNLTRVRRQN